MNTQGPALPLMLARICGSANAGCGWALAAALTMFANTVSNDCNAYSPMSLASDYGSRRYSGFDETALPLGAVPEPPTLALFGLGLCALALRRQGRCAVSVAKPTEARPPSGILRTYNEGTRPWHR